MNIKRLTNNDIIDINRIQECRGFAKIKNDIIPNNWVVYGAYEGDNIIGICFLFEYRRIPHSDYPSGYIAEIGGAYTMPEHRHKGIMTELVKTIMENRKNDIPICDAIVADATDEAVSIYKKFGFEQSTEHRVWCRL